MIFYTLCLSLGLLSSQLIANQHMPDVMHDKRQMVNSAVQNVNELFDVLLYELNESTTIHQAARRKAEERENELRVQLMSLERENEQMRTIQAELNMAHKDMQKAMENEAMLKNKLAQLQQQAGKEISNMRNEFEAFKTRLEKTTNNFDKVFW